MTAIDAFADKETRELAEDVFVAEYHHDGFDENSLLATIGRIDVNKFVGFVYGSGMESQPRLLQEISKRIPLLGNTAESVDECKTARKFFADLDELDIRYPAVLDTLPESPDDRYVIKHAAGCGGNHVRYAQSGDVLHHNWYFQQFVDGDSVSLLFIANGSNVEAVGYNEQWTSGDGRFCYGGAVSQAQLSSKVRRQLVEAAEKLTRRWHLVGLNSIDAVVKDELVLVLEVNPRLSATMELYVDVVPDLMGRHVQACRQKTMCGLPKMDGLSNNAKAHAIVYAPLDVMVSDQVVWPEWVTDTPILKGSTKISAGMPVCTVLADGFDAPAAKRLVKERCEEVKNFFVYGIWG